jgi:aldose 1-epimerase
VGIVLSAGGDRVEVDPYDGARLTSFVAGGKERLLNRPPDPSSPDVLLLWGCFFMAPWVGRIADGELPWEGQTHRFPKNFGGHAIHGLVFDKVWSVDDPTETSVAMSADLAAAGWPFDGSVRYRIDLAPGRLTLSARIDAADRSMPVSVGWHPYFARPSEGDLTVTVPADHVLETTEDLIPTGQLIPVAGDTDLREGPALGERRLDHVYAGARSPAIVGWPDLELHLNFDPPIETVVVYTPPHAACVEPQSAWPNAPALHESGTEGTGLTAVAPRDRFEATTTWTWGS